MTHVSSKLASVGVLILCVGAADGGCGSGGGGSATGGAAGHVDGGGGGNTDAGADRADAKLGSGGATGAGGAGGGGAPGNGGAAGGVAAFIGSWHPTAGNVTFTCGAITMPETVTANLTAAAGTTSDLVLQTNGSCSLRANAAANVATALAGQTCSLTMGGLGAMLAFTSYTFSPSTDGLTAMERATGTATVSQGGTTINCTYNETASYQKL